MQCLLAVFQVSVFTSLKAKLVRLVIRGGVSAAVKCVGIIFFESNIRPV